MLRPPTPKNERPSVTIANLERGNDNLAARIDELSKRHLAIEIDRNEWRKKAQEQEREANFARLGSRTALESLEQAQAKIAKLESVLCGYRQAIMDVNGHIADMVSK